MSNYASEDKFISSVTKRLKQLSRRVMKLDTKDEILQYLADTFMEQLNCDFVAIAMLEEGQIVLKSLVGGFTQLARIFPYPVQQANPILFETSIMSTQKILKPESPIELFFQQEAIESWFTMPIADEAEPYGLCIIGYYNQTVFYEEMQQYLDDFGNYIAIALSLIKKNQQQASRMLEMGWVTQGSDFDNDLKDLISNVVNFSATEVKAVSASVYLLDDTKEYLSLMTPTYGVNKKNEEIELVEGNLVQNYFPNVEQVGFSKISIPLMVNVELVGVMYVEKMEKDFFTGYDLTRLQMYANYFSANYENMQLNLKERRQSKRLAEIIKIQQKFIQKTVESDEFGEINHFLSHTLESSVILFDRFMNLLDYHLLPGDPLSTDEIIMAAKKIRNTEILKQSSFMMEITAGRYFEAMAIHDGTKLHAYIMIEANYGDNTELLALIINMVNSIYSLQFIKRQIESNAHEQIKSNFVQLLLDYTPDKLDQVVEYASVFNWDLYQAYRLAILTIKPASIGGNLNLVEVKTEMNAAYDFFSTQVKQSNRETITTVLNDQLIIFTPVQGLSSRTYWENVVEHFDTAIGVNEFQLEYGLGVGGIADSPEEYAENYQ